MDYISSWLGSEMSIENDLFLVSFLPKLQHRENEKSLNLTRLTRSDAIRLNPITIILERCAEMLYRHPVVHQYVSLKFRQDLISAGIVANFVLSSVFILALNMFAFSIPPPAHFFQKSNSTDQEQFCSGIGRIFTQHSSISLLMKLVQN